MDGRTKHWIMKRLLHGTLRLRNSPAGEQIQNDLPMDEITRDTITLDGHKVYNSAFSGIPKRSLPTLLALIQAYAPYQHAAFKVGSSNVASQVVSFWRLSAA